MKCSNFLDGPLFRAVAVDGFDGGVVSNLLHVRMYIFVKGQVCTRPITRTGSCLAIRSWCFVVKTLASFLYALLMNFNGAEACLALIGSIVSD